MTIDLLQRVVAFVVLVVVQALVLNHIHLFGVATPLFYVYFVLLFRRNHPKWIILLTSFLLGLCIDVFSNTPGLAAASTTFIAVLQPYILEPFIPRDSDENLKPGMRTLGIGRFVYYTVFMVFLYNIVFFSLEAFNFFNWLQWLLCICGSTLLTVVLILVVENLRRS
ncbi:MAG: rod shape-determining protein MreD [Prevotella sp.]|nr:rod shape-determining protein MreD [Prevotella sp.]